MRRYFWHATVLLVIGALASVASAAQEKTSAPEEAQVTFDRDIAPIVFHSCAMCHRPGESGPFSLLSYKDAKAHARQIAKVTREQFMPPWLPDSGEYKIAGELRLTDEEIARIQKWYEQGAVEGAAADLPPAPHFVEGWQLGKPDEVVKAEKAFSLGESGQDTYWNFVFRTPVDRTRWLRAVEIRPGDKRAVHHANILVDRGESSRKQEAHPGDGFGGMDLRIESEAFDPDSHFLFWKPGTVPEAEPEGMSLRLDKDTDLVLNVHMQPSGKPQTIQPSLGLYFADRPATIFPLLLQLEGDGQLDIPAGVKNFLVTDEFKLPVDVDLLAIYPHAHYLGKEMFALATLPDGTQKTLLHIAHWDLNWQAVYRYEKPVPLPAGTTVAMRYTYDNSKDNLVNPNNPPQRVVAGNRASDEMAHLWIQVLPHAAAGNARDPRKTLQEAMARHNLEKNPGDFEAHYNLAALLQERGQFSEAIQNYREAVRCRPDSATANNALGGALLGAGQVDEAIIYLNASLKAEPQNFDAHYNLGSAFAALEKFAEATEQFRLAVRLNPQDANAEANLGSALAVSGNLEEAKAHFERALKINPELALARENLAQVNEMLAHPR